MVTQGSGTIGDAGKAWDAVRADSGIQYAPVPVPPPSKPPGWLEAFFDWLGRILSPVGEALGVGWPVLKWTLIAIAVVALALLAWRVLGPVIGWKVPRRAHAEDEADWTPASHEALALLADADRLAAEGRFDEATHLLLRRSVGQIAAARPEWVEPATTARELSRFEALPDGARRAFATIAERVERSLFALRALGAEDWQAARAAYADFALARLTP